MYQNCKYSITDSMSEEQFMYNMFWYLECFCDQHKSCLHYLLQSTPKFANMFRIALSYKFSLKDVWLVLYTSNSLLYVLSKSTTEFPEAVIFFFLDMLSWKDLPLYRKDEHLRAVLSVYLFRTNRNQAVDSVSVDRSKAKK